MTFNFDDDDLWSPMRNRREWERQLRDGERQPTFYESLEPFRKASRKFEWWYRQQLERLVPLVLFLTRMANWVGEKID